jgi:hypothetical protein
MNSAYNQLELLEVLPDPISLIESMRAVGYSVEAAVADLIDNSLSAGATKISVAYDGVGAPFVAILDNGHGMSSSEITEAMRHGKNPNDPREKSDLGRFGLGLKTASLSQCRKLTVVSKKEEQINARCWDLDLVAEKNSWVVKIPSFEEIGKFSFFGELSKQESGTLVIWEGLDKLLAGAKDADKEITLKFHGLLEYLALIFHRFTQKELGFKEVSIDVNGQPLPFRDPFLRTNSYRQTLEGQVIRHERGDVIITPHILPPVNHLTLEEIVTTGGLDGLRNSQGFYIYRGRRLVIWGTWFRLVPKEEFFKLSRIQVDIPNSFDELWSLDIKKSAAFPPDVIRNRLKELIPHFANTSRKTVTYPGRKRSTNQITPLWERIEPAHGLFKYEINEEHPLVRRLSEQLDGKLMGNLRDLISAIEFSLPVEAIYADLCNDTSSKLEADVEELIRIGRILLESNIFSADDVLKMEPLSRYPKLHDEILKGLNV